MVCGNKKDLEDSRVISTMEASKFCQEKQVNFLETSALNGENVSLAFEMATKNIMNLIEKGTRLMWHSGKIDSKDLKPKLRPISCDLKENGDDDENDKKRRNCLACWMRFLFMCS